MDMNKHDCIVPGLTYEELIHTVQANEKEMTEDTIVKVMDEIIAIQLDDAYFMLASNMDAILEEVLGEE